MILNLEDRNAWAAFVIQFPEYRKHCVNTTVTALAHLQNILNGAHLR